MKFNFFFRTTTSVIRAYSSTSSSSVIPETPTLPKPNSKGHSVQIAQEAQTFTFMVSPPRKEESPSQMMDYYQKQIPLPRMESKDRRYFYPPQGKSPVLVEDDKIDMQQALASPMNLQMVRLKELESMWIVSNNKKAAYVKVNNDSEAILLVHPDFKNVAEDLSYIAASINDGSIAVLHDQGLHKKVSVKFAKTKADFKERAREMEADDSLSTFGTTRTFRLMCYCNTPLVTEQHSRSIGNALLKQKCPCGEQKHEKCVSPSDQREMINYGFKCATCIVKDITPGLQWSAPPAKGKGGRNIDMTCPIDNPLTSMSIFMTLQNQDLEAYMPNNLEHEQLSSTLELVKKGKFNDAQVKFYDELKDHLQAMKPKDRPVQLEKDSLFGNVLSVFHLKHREGLQFSLKSQCANEKCKNEVTTKDTAINLGYYLNDPSKKQGLDSIEQLNWIMSGYMGDCRKCKQESCRAKKIICSDEQWGLILDAQYMNTEAQTNLKHDILSGKLPDTVNGDSKGKIKFGLASVILNDPHTHYTAAHWVPQEQAFVFYDGMRPPAQRIRKLHPSDLFKTNRAVSAIEYYRLK